MSDHGNYGGSRRRPGAHSLPLGASHRSPKPNNNNNGNNSGGGGGSGGGYSRPGEAAASMLSRINKQQTRHRLEAIEALRNAKNSADYLRQMPRRWEAGDVYSPHDLSPVEMQKWRRRSPRTADVVDALAIRPLDMYKNFSLVQEFTTSSGQILHSAATRLRPVNQRKVAKMVRRVQGMGLYPTIHDHPEMMREHFYPEKK